jgi:hypothetical protein
MVLALQLAARRVPRGVHPFKTHEDTIQPHRVMFPETKVMVRVLAYEDVGKYP